MTIAVSDSLTIMAGVEVRFAGHYTMTVYGDLQAIGTASAPIEFTSHFNNPQPGDWKGIYFYNSGIDDYLSYTNIHFAEYGVRIVAEDNTVAPTIEHAFIEQSLYDGIKIVANSFQEDTFARPHVLSSTISMNGANGIYIFGYGGSGRDDDGYAQPVIRNTLIRANQVHGIYLYGRLAVLHMHSDMQKG
ncbi:MAG: right-handed parallel beta-helix repeat-containing protein [Caldilineaceae bacterium]